MQKIRSIFFTISFDLTVLFLAIVCLPLLLLPRKFVAWYPQMTSRVTNKMLEVICGVKIKVEGLENLPKEKGYIIASKHQSAMETTVFHRILPNIFYVLKKELLYLPIVNFYFIRTGCVAIDRKGGTRTMRQMLSAVQKRIAQGMNLIIFPEGTRTAPGSKKPYSPGVALLYEQCQVPVVPVALNTGYCWPKNSVMKYAGTVTIKFLKPIPTGLHRRAFLTELYDRIEEAQDNLPHPFEAK